MSFKSSKYNKKYKSSAERSLQRPSDGIWLRPRFILLIDALCSKQYWVNICPTLYTVLAQYCIQYITPVKCLETCTEKDLNVETFKMPVLLQTAYIIEHFDVWNVFLCHHILKLQTLKWSTLHTDHFCFTI